MDAVTWLAWTAAGVGAGTATGMLPGLHVNTLAAVVLAATAPTPGLAVAFVAMGTVHTFVNILPATYLGVPDEDAPVAVLPAHRMLLWGAGPDAVRLSLHASLAAAVVAVASWPLYQFVLRDGVLALLDGVTPWILLAAVAVLWWLERPRGWNAVGWAVATTLLAGILGLASAEVPVRAVAGLPASPMLPLLGGLFGAAGLVTALRHATWTPPQGDPSPVRVRMGPVCAGAAVAAGTAVLPGLTSATATALARAGRRDDDPRPVLATLSAVDTAHAVLAIAVLWILVRARTGLAQAVQSWVPVVPWDRGVPPQALLWLAATVLVAAVAAVAAGTLLDRPFRAAAARVPPRWLSGFALALLSLLVAALSGLPGMALYAVAAVLGLVPLCAGIRRVHLTGCLILPVLWHHWT